MFTQSSVANPLILFNARDMFTDHMFYNVTIRYYILHIYYIHIASRCFADLVCGLKREHRISILLVNGKRVFDLIASVGNKQECFLAHRLESGNIKN